MQTVMIFLGIGLGIGVVVLSIPALRRRTSPGESLSVGATGAVFLGLLGLIFGGDNLTGPVSALHLLASATGAAALLGITLASGRTRTPRQQREKVDHEDARSKERAPSGGSDVTNSVELGRSPNR